MGSCVGSEKPQKIKTKKLADANSFDNYRQSYDEFNQVKQYDASLKSANYTGGHRTRPNSVVNEDAESFVRRKSLVSRNGGHVESFTKKNQDVLMQRPKSIPGAIEAEIPTVTVQQVISKETAPKEVESEKVENMSRKASTKSNRKHEIDRFEIKNSKDKSLAIEFDKDGFDGDEIEEEDLAILAQYLLENDEFNASEIQILTSRGQKSAHQRSVRTANRKSAKSEKAPQQIKRDWDRISRMLEDDVRQELRHDLDMDFEKDLELDLITACDIGDYQSVLFLLENAVDCDAEEQNGMTALCYAAQKGHIDIVKLLAQCNVDLNHMDKSGMTPLMHAAERGHISVVEFLISQSANVHWKNTNEMNALMLAANNGYKKTVKLLLKTDININAKNQNEMTALMLAASNGHNKVIRTLLQNDANLNDVDKHGKNVLMIAAEKGYADIVENLMSYEIDVNVKDNENMTALMHAAKNAKKREKKKIDETGKHFAKVVELLVKNKADVNWKNNIGWTALMLAARQGSTEIVETLLKHNAYRHSKNSDGDSASKIAAAKDHQDVVQLLLNFDASKKETNIEALIAPLQTTKKIKKTKPFPNPAEIDTSGKNRDQVRVTKTPTESKEFFITAVDVSGNRISEMSNYVNPTSSQGISKQSSAVSRSATQSINGNTYEPKLEDYYEIVPIPRQAIEYKKENTASGESVKRVESSKLPSNQIIQNPPNSAANSELNKKSFLISACQKGQFAVVEALVASGMNINEKDNYNMTPLMHASNNAEKSDANPIIKSDYAKIVELLVSNKADLNCKNNDGMTALMLAVKQEAIDVVEILIKNQSDLFAKNNQNETVFQIASKHDDQATIQYLLYNSGVKVIH